MLKSDIRFLGTSGGKSKNHHSTCVQVTSNIIIDAGNIIDALGDEAKHIDHIFLTHSHLDHIQDIAFLIDMYFELRDKPLKIYGLRHTLDALNKYIFNWDVWPDFSEIELIRSSHKSVELIEIECGREYPFKGLLLKPIELNHTVPTCGYIIKKENFATFYATDTYICDNVWKELNEDKDISSLIIDVSFPTDMHKLALQSKHLTPGLLKRELNKLARDDVSVYVTHIKPAHQEIVEKELEILEVLLGDGRVIKDGEYLKNIVKNETHLKSVLNISAALSKEKDLSKILTLILVEAMNYTDSEGGTIYLKEGDYMTFKAVKNDKLDIFDINNKNLAKINLYPNGEKNRENVSAVCALNKETINIPDIYLYHIGGFNFDGAKKFDKENNYRTKSMLVVPMMSDDNEVIGVMQLINKRAIKDVVPFTNKDIDMITTYANLSASAITKNKLIEDLEKLVLSFLESIAYAFNMKSPYGYGHISNVKDLMIAAVKEIDQDNTIYKDISYTEDEFKELELAAWMHDIGKIATPEYILDKATRLETLQDQIYAIELRFNFVKYYLKYQVSQSKNTDLINEYERDIKEIDGDLVFVKQSNLSSTYMSDQDICRIHNIGKKKYIIDSEPIFLLSRDEVNYLCIVRGTLTKQERQKINDHAKISHEMLKMITFPKKYNNVAKIASGHHEKLNGKGYPFGLKGDEICFETRILAIVDIIEALTASDRPYKRAKTQEETFEILEAMVNDGELDKDLVLFIKRAKIYEKFIEKKSIKVFFKTAMAEPLA